MKKIIYILLITLIFIVVVKLFYIEKNKSVEVFHEFTEKEYLISFKYNPNNWDIKNYNERDYEYISYVKLLNKEKKQDIYISFRYENQNNGDDTPQQVGDTGAELYPPQRSDLVNPFDSEKYTYIGTHLGKELYVTGYNTFGSSVVVQKLSDGMVTGVMPLLSEDQDRVNYFDKFVIDADYGTDPDQQEQLHKEFIKILKSMEITPMQKPE